MGGGRDFAFVEDGVDVDVKPRCQGRSPLVTKGARGQGFTLDQHVRADLLLHGWQRFNGVDDAKAEGSHHQHRLEHRPAPVLRGWFLFIFLRFHFVVGVGGDPLRWVSHERGKHR